jgi:hypothetical protein
MSKHNLRPVEQPDSEILQVPGLPELTGKLDLQGRARARELEDEIDREALSYALAERELQLASMIQKLRERS